MNERKISVGDRLLWAEKTKIALFSEAAPIAFEKDDDFQIDFIAAATVNVPTNPMVDWRFFLL